MKTKVFVYKGYLGINSHPKSEGLVNATGLGVIMEGNKIEISKEAIAMLEQAPKSGGSYAPIQVFAAGDKIIFGWEGPLKVVFSKKSIILGRGDNASLLKPSEVEVPKDFKDYIDSL